ncbi:MAG: A/G-specific adenine glycosylase [Patescibacteria group bacterium]|nr:A/G-specific adenine glycosylase [Patescibacteria group bacterium]
MPHALMTTSAFRQTVWRFYRAHGRHDLPWRKTRDPYKILVSEVMLQQTQVERVIPFYRTFLKKFPTVRALARAPLSDVLKSWQGLGYNRRAKLLQDAAQELARTPLSATRSNLVQRLEELPGVGPYTARAVAAFAFNQNGIIIETNIRTAIIYHFFPKGNTTIYGSISDRQVEKVLAETLPQGKSREWYSALMDYGAHLKKSGVRLNARSRHYAKQSRFAGSLREVRGAILRELALGELAGAALTKLFSKSRHAQLRAALAALMKEGLVRMRNRRYLLAEQVL